MFEKLLSDIRIMVKRAVSAKLPIGVLNVKKNFYRSTSCYTPYLKRNANGSGRVEINEGRRWRAERRVHRHVPAGSTRPAVLGVIPVAGPQSVTLAPEPCGACVPERIEVVDNNVL